jgi:hypothetical protein
MGSMPMRRNPPVATFALDPESMQMALAPFVHT